MTQRLGAEVRRRQIMQATLSIVAREGVSHFTSARLAAEVGISEAAVYKYFSGKEEILSETMGYVHNTLAERVETILERDLSARKKFWEVLQFQLSFLEENQGIPRVVFSEQLYLGSPAMKERFLFSMGRYFNLLKGLINSGVEEGAFRRDLDLEMATSAYMGLIQVTVFRWSVDNFSWSLSGRARGIYKHLLNSWS